MALSFTLSEEDKDFLGRQAVLSIESGVTGDTAATPQNPPDNAEAGASVLIRDLGSFVTLTIKHALRGCIGTIIGREPLYLNVWNMARAAAFNDPRFPPLKLKEWPHVELEISVLDEPTPCPSVNEIVIGRDGLILQYAGHSAVFLPQVPVEQNWDLNQYLAHLCIKAGLAPDSWTRPGARLFWYQAAVFPVMRQAGGA